MHNSGWVCLPTPVGGELLIPILQRERLKLGEADGLGPGHGGCWM